MVPFPVAMACRLLAFRVGTLNRVQRQIGNAFRQLSLLVFILFVAYGTTNIKHVMYICLSLIKVGDCYLYQAPPSRVIRMPRLFFRVSGVAKT